MSTPAVIPQIPASSLPPQLRAGDLFTWAVQTQMPYPVNVVFVLTAIVNNSPVRIAIPPVAVDGNGVATFSIPSTTTATWTAGRYQWVCFGFDANSNRTELAQGVISIQPDVNGTAPVDYRTNNQKLLGAIKALLQGKALDDAVMYKIGTRELTKMPIKDLLYWEAIVESRVRRERIRRGELVPTRTVGITFGGR